MVDVLTLTFVLIILLAGGLLAVTLNRVTTDNPDPGGGALESARRRSLADLRRMERRRLGIWWKMDELHEEFLRRTANAGLGPPPAEPARTLVEKESGPPGGIKAGEVREAFEEFLRRR